MEYCSTCTGSLASSPPYSQDAASFPQDRRVECCSRVICAKLSSTPSPLPQGLRDPPLYTSVPSLGSRSIPASAPPPPYKSVDDAPPAKSNKSSTPEFDEKAALDDTLHFLDHDHDTVQSLSLRYGVPPAALRRRNNLTSDHLLVGRKTILIPGEFYKGGVSLSPRPVEGEEEELRKGKIRRFMTLCKVADYDYALLYMEQAGYDIDAAIVAYMDDEVWERTHPNRRERNAEANKVKSRGLFWRGL
ncbi:hypothetical protein M431DRAFT_491113 [Trichoderma harzianum CBS 226.95]|uniref:LysM domain-containing protein n=1 Tax=Trichoderma harzianum CBS 226.95 TaxID=983964 RepID=A0A2T4AR45_TRIHA|nr:hypothetical protein M431DRAFT_491113 [Trichoderma harzianum CBS 226.95]PTB59519.1 hypothetical protein M431DRAFT_491113 [Trichoderma harzianum CBS 226.95]